MNIYLIGYRGTGKSTIAPLLASGLGPPWAWKDLDVELERRFGRTISQVFASDGEDAFRDLEEQTLASAAALDQQVIATGGGAILRQANRNCLAKGWVVWLTARPETIFARINADTTTAGRRPNLTVGGMTEIETILASREPLYRSLANLIVNTEEAPLTELASRILEAYRARSEGASGCR